MLRNLPKNSLNKFKFHTILNSHTWGPVAPLNLSGPASLINGRVVAETAHCHIPDMNDRQNKLG